MYRFYGDRILKKFNKRAFTLAELMVSMGVLGILAAVLVHVANNSRPNENVMKFKKAYITLGNVVRELVTSDKYYYEGNFTQKPNKNANPPYESASSDYFCKTMADVLSTKSVNCVKTNTGLYNTSSMSNFDYACLDAQDTLSSAEIVTADGVNWYMANPGIHFPTSRDSDGFYDKYRIVCFDVDGMKKGSNPFGFGVRVDGKILSGARANVWSSECNIQKVNYAQLVSEGKISKANAKICQQ